MSTESLRRDHDLITKAVRAMESTVQLLSNGTKIPESILLPVIEFTTNFTDVCHHGKEEESLFPALERAGMPSNMGPIAVMLLEHQQSREIAKRIESSTKEYLESGNSDKLITDMKEYIQHITEHLWKENNRLFAMADARLQDSATMNTDLDKTETIKLNSLGKSRDHYEKLVHDIHDNISKL